MKKLLSVLLTATISLLIIIFPTVNGETVKTDNNYRYVVQSDNTIKITRYLGDESKIIIPDKIDGLEVTKIAKGAFKKLQNITYVKVPDSVTYIGTDAFWQCSKLSTVKLGKGIKKINSYTFDDCISLKSFTIPENVTTMCRESIPPYVEQLTIGCSVKNVSVGDFTGTFSIKEFKVSKKNKHFASKDGVLYNKKMNKIIAYPTSKNGSKFTVPKSVKNIGDNAFEYTKKLQTINFSKNVKVIGKYAFQSCKNIESITINKNIISVGDLAFFDCRNLSELHIADNKKLKFGSDVFSSCDSLKNVTLPNVAKLGYGMFDSCEKLKKVTISKDVKIIPDSAFLNCESLKNVTIPNSVTKIGKRAFGYMYSYDYEVYYKIDSFIIKGKKGSAAQRYAKRNGFKFVAI